MDNKLSVSKDLVLFFGDRNDGVIGIPARTHDGHIVETSCFYGKARPKPIFVISSQAGCPMACLFCEIGSERFGRNLTALEMRDQVRLMCAEAGRAGLPWNELPGFKLTVANSGEPMLNPELVGGLEEASEAAFPMAFKVSTVFPEATQVMPNLRRLAEFANSILPPTYPEHLAGYMAPYTRHVQVQVSLISTSERIRNRMAGGHVAPFKAIHEAGEIWRSLVPKGRKVNLSLIVSKNMPCDVREVASVFPPDLFHFRFREYVPTSNGIQNRVHIVSADRLARIKTEFAAEGYEVGDWGSPSPVERRFGLSSNGIRRKYLDMLCPHS